ncbi:aldo/keto reductase [Treponema primitia]|uniref:aldo/keto reductase n=1 Tax=Treponema primitia TaxID=88058 RepID=UPI00397F1AF2
MKKLGFGCMRLPLLDEGDQTRVDMEQTKKMVDTFLERGFTYFDTAWMYHDFQSEIVIREALVKRYLRDSFQLATKLPTFSLEKEGDAERIFNEQLQKCGVEYFDYYLLHALTNNYELTKRFDCFGFIRQKKAEGKIKKIGFSFHDRANLLDEILTEHPETDFVQLQINYLDWNSESIQSGSCYEVCEKHGKPVIVMEPVKGGMLAFVPEKAERLMKAYAPDASPTSWALRFAASHQNVMTVLSGMSRYEQLDENTRIYQDFSPLCEAEFEIVKAVTKIIQESISIPCTGCRYCVAGCPQNIAIPEYFSLYNAEKQHQANGFSIHTIYYGNYTKHNGKASACIECKQCEEHCPQHLPVIQNLKQVAALFEKSNG